MTQIAFKPMSEINHTHAHTQMLQIMSKKLNH